MAPVERQRCSAMDPEMKTELDPHQEAPKGREKDITANQRIKTRETTGESRASARRALRFLMTEEIPSNGDREFNRAEVQQESGILRTLIIGRRGGRNLVEDKYLILWPGLATLDRCAAQASDF